MGHDDKKHRDNAPVNPLSPHADDPAWEQAPPKDGNGLGGEYDQKPYVVRADEVDQTPESGEYDRDEPRKDRTVED